MQLVHASDDGVALYEAAIASGLEGVVGKRKDSRYQAGRRSAAWIKVKATQTADFVVGGYTKGKGARDGFGALLVGYWQGRQLRYASHVGSGFDGKNLAQVHQRLVPLKRGACPFSEPPETNGKVAWVEPNVAVEVKFQSWTDDGRLRAPVFKGVEPAGSFPSWEDEGPAAAVWREAADFAELARVHSDDATAARGGELDWVYPGDTVPDFERAYRELKPGEISQPVRTPFGYHLIQVLERRSADMSPERRRLQARMALRERKSEEAYQEWLRQLRDQIYVELRLEER